MYVYFKAIICISKLNNPLRIYGSLKVDKIICNSIYDYDYTEKTFKPLTFGTGQVKGLQTDLSNKEPLLNLTPNRVIVSDPNSQRGALISSIYIYIYIYDHY